MADCAKISFCIGVIVMAYIGAIRGQMLGEATVRLTNVEQCPDAEQYPYRLQVSQRKVNRSTVAYSGSLNFDIFADDKVGIFGSVSKLADGGYKPNAYEIKDTNLCKFFMKMFPESFTTALRLAGIEEKCPIPPGSYTITDFIIDYDTLPKSLLYGDFRVDTFAVLNETQERLVCIRFYVTSKPKDDKFA